MGNKADVTVRLIRSPKHRGIVVQLKTTPLIEEFFRELASNTTTGVDELSSALGWHPIWKPLNPGTTLLVYGGDKKLYAPMQTDFRYSLLHVGTNVNLAAQTTNQYDTNISFLRLVGIGSETGVEFLLTKTVMSEAEMQRIRDSLLRNIKNFYLNFVKPVEVVGEVLRGNGGLL